MSIQNSHQISDVKVMLKVGADGSGIESIEKTGTSGIVDTYTITMTDGTKSTFTVTNGSSIESIEKTSTVGLVDTYTITLTNGDTSTFEVHNASGGGMLAHILITSDAGSTVTVTTPSGDVITATQVTGSTTQWECDTQEYGVHIIDAVLDGDDAQYSLTVDTCKVYSIDDSHMHATITVTYPQGFTCRCQGNGENYYANSNPYTFSVHSLGTFTITATDGTTTYTETVVISSSSQAETIYCPSVANAPTEDVQLWLMYGDITDKNYTTLAEVLADTTTYSALIADHDAVDYLARSIGWASSAGLVPQMTSNTTPSGECLATYSHSSFPPYKMFDGDSVATGSNCWITQQDGIGGYKFTTPKVVTKAIIYPVKSAGASASSKDWDIVGSNDDFATYDVLYSGSNTDSANPVTVTFANTTKYECYGIKLKSSYRSDSYGIMEMQFYSVDGNGITEDSTAMSIIGLNNYASDTLLSDADWNEAIQNSAYFESIDNAKVPIMTSNTTPSGECSAIGSADTSALPYFAFDGSNATDWTSAPAQTANAWIQYDFGMEVIVKKIAYMLVNPSESWTLMSNVTIYLEGSNDNSIWKSIDSATVSSTQFKTLVTQNVNNNDAYRYYRIKFSSATFHAGNYDYTSMATLQFYGRVDI